VACKIGSSSCASKHEVVAWPGDNAVDRAGDGAAESMLAVAWCRHRVMLVKTLSSPACDGAAESMMAVARQGATVDRLGVTADRQGATGARQGAVVGCLGVAVDRLGAVDARQATVVDHRGVVADREGAVVDRQGAAANRRGATDDCWSARCRCRLSVAKMSLTTVEKGSRYEVLIVEAIDLDVWIFTPAPQWAPTVVPYDNDLVESSRD
jgi:hypothetical protein